MTTPSTIERGYPSHCIGCWKLDSCRQKQYMLAGTDPVPGYTVGEEGDHWDIACEECAEKYPSSEPICGSNETDSPDHCCDCGVPIQCELTEYGREYVRESLEEDRGCCRELWSSLWPELAPKEDEKEEEEEK